MKLRPLSIGVESISRWEVEHERHLPHEGRLSPTFLPVHRPLDEILRRPSLDERLSSLLQPETLDEDLLQPAALSEVRMRAAATFARAARREHGRVRNMLQAAADILEHDIGLDEDVRRSLAMLLRG